MNLQGLGKISKASKKIKIIGVSIIVLLGVFVLLYFFKLNELKDIKAEIIYLDKKIKNARKIERQFQPISQEEESILKETESKMSLVVPSEKDISLQGYELARLAKKNNISNMFFISEKEVNRRFSNRVSKKEITSRITKQAEEIFDKKLSHFLVRLSCKADYKDLANFLDDIQKADRFLEIESLMMRKDFHLILVEMVVKFYYIET